MRSKSTKNNCEPGRIAITTEWFKMSSLPDCAGSLHNVGQFTGTSVNLTPYQPTPQRFQYIPYKLSV